MRSEHADAPGGQPRAGGDQVDAGSVSSVNDGSDNAGDSIPGVGVFHRKMLRDSAISPAVASARKYRSLMRDTRATTESRDTLKRLGFSRELWDNERRQAGLLIPLYGPTGALASWQFRPDNPRTDDKGKVRRYEMPRGRAAVLDVHPDNRDRVADPTVELWITEGIKTADALTSAGQCVAALSGVYNWRSTHGTLGDWEDVPLRGRTVVIVFDADAATNRHIARAMARLGRWLKSRGASPQYIVCPQADGNAKTGADDFLAAGGTMEQLASAALSRPPDPDAGDDSLTDSRLAERVADDHLRGRYRYCPPLGGWLEYDGAIWRETTDVVAVEQVRQYLRDMLHQATDEGASPDRLKALAGLQSRSRIASIAALTRGMDGIHTDPLDFDEDPWMLCVGNGVVDLRTGELHPHDPDYMMLRRTTVDYVPDATHRDWVTALGALPADCGDYMQVFMGTGCVGLQPSDDTMHFWVGAGRNGKTTVAGAAMDALGDYAAVVSSMLLGGSKPGHPTVKMELFRRRLAVVEELQEGHQLDESRVKEITGSAGITGNRMHRDPVTFAPTHSMIVATNHAPRVTGTDRGIWRRLVAVPFDNLYQPDTPGYDQSLRLRLRAGRVQQQAVLAWLVDGARRYHRAGQVLPGIPQSVAARTDQWRYDGDPLARFVEQRGASDPSGDLETTVVLSAFNDWMDVVEGGKAWSARTFTERLKAHDRLRDDMGVTVGKHPRTRRSMVRGLRLLGPREDPDGDAL